MPYDAKCEDDLSWFDPSYPHYHLFSAVQWPTTSSGHSREKCCTDRAGNTHCETKTYKVKHRHEDSSCGVKRYNECRAKACCVESYNSCRTSGCGVASYKSCKSSSCGRAVDYYECRSWSTGGILYTCMPKCGICPNGHWHAHYGYKTCRSASCGVESYKYCEHSQCGVKQYKKCRTSACGVEEYNTCYHYKPCDKY